jgi:hypothetical protein
MAANIVKPTKHAVAPTQCEELPSRRIQGQITPWLLEFLGGSEHMPMSAKYRLPFPFKQRLIDVIPGVEIQEAWFGCDHREFSAQDQYRSHRSLFTPLSNNQGERAEVRTAGRSRKRRSPPGLRHPLLEHNYPRTKVVRTATASERPSVGHGRARGNEPARTSLGASDQYEASTNDEPRHQPARPETRPNQRLYVPLGSPPSVAVGSSSTRAAH